MSSGISSSALASQLAASYQRLAQAQARVQESKAQVESDQAQLERSQHRNTQDRRDYAQALRKNQTLEQSDKQYAVQNGTGAQQVSSDTTTSSAVSVSKPTVNSSGQTVGSLISVTA